MCTSWKYNTIIEKHPTQCLDLWTDCRVFFLKSYLHLMRTLYRSELSHEVQPNNLVWFCANKPVFWRMWHLRPWGFWGGSRRWCVLRFSPLWAGWRSRRTGPTTCRAASGRHLMPSVHPASWSLKNQNKTTCSATNQNSMQGYNVSRQRRSLAADLSRN